MVNCDVNNIVFEVYGHENMKNGQYGNLSVYTVLPDVTHIFSLTCRWSLWNVRTEDHRWSQQSRTWEDKHGRDRQISTTQAVAISLLSWQLNTGVTADSFQCRAELLKRTFVWSRRLVNNALIMRNLRAAVGRKISLLHLWPASLVRWNDWVLRVDRVASALAQ